MVRALIVIVVALSACEAQVDLFPRRVDGGGGGAPMAADCTQLRELPVDAPVAVTLYATPDVPFSAWCSSDGGTWLVLSQTGDANVSRVVANGEWLGTTVVTRFEAIRIERADGGGLYDVIKRDLTFSSSTGRVVNIPGDFDVTTSPYLSPSDCVMPESASAAARGDLRGTPFAFVPGGLRITGFRPGGSISWSAWNQVVDVLAGGYCGGIAGEGPLQLRLCVEPGPETCDGKDNDCNGVIDDTAAVCP